MNTKRFSNQILRTAGLALVLVSAVSSDAFAVTALKQVQVTNGSQIDLLFDGKVAKNQIKAEFFNDVIQLSLMDVSVYPAKISSVSGGNITKIFAYQYAPKLVRCRLTVKGNAESYKDKISLINSGAGGKVLTISLNGAAAATTAESDANTKSDRLVLQASRAKTKPHAETDAEKTKEAKIDDADEKALLDHVLKSNPAETGKVLEKAGEKIADKLNDKVSEKAIEKSPFANTTNPEKSQFLGRNESHSLTGAKALPSPMGALGKLAFVVGLFSLLALGFKKFWKDKAEAQIGGAGLMASIGQFAKKNLGSRSKKMIEVVSNHHLGPKKSIAVVKIAGRMLVLGITDESINLITQISDVDSDLGDVTENAINDMGASAIGEIFSNANSKKSTGTGATSAGPALFSNILNAETSKPAMGTPVANNRLARPATDVRVTGYGKAPAASTPAAPYLSAPIQGRPAAMNAQTAAGLSGVRAQIRSKLEGLKQI